MRWTQTLLATLATGVCSIGIAIGCTSATSLPSSEAQEKQDDMDTDNGTSTSLATFGGGCFWCTEAIFEEVEGVKSVKSGYSGGQVKNPTYQQVCEGTTGHAEAVQVEFDPNQVSYEELLEIFWKTHDPTTLNRQGYDFGTQYRSVIFFHDDQQKEIAEQLKQKLDESGAFSRPVVTEIAPLDVFYVAEDYHQDYFANNPEQGYCQAVIAPKMEKFRQVFDEKIKSK